MWNLLRFKAWNSCHFSISKTTYAAKVISPFNIEIRYTQTIMLQILRNKAQSTFIQIVVVIIALVFIFWGVGTNMMNTREVALTVNDEDITFQQYQQAHDQAMKGLSEQFGGTIPKGLDESLGIKQQVIDQLVQTTLLRQGAGRMGLRVSAEEIQKQITGMPQFLEKGSFNIERYNSLLAANRMTPNSFENSMRYDMLSDKTVQDIAKFATIVTDAEIQDLYSQENETVSVQFVKIPSDAFKKEMSVDKAELQKWFNSVKDKYRSEPQLKLKYIVYSDDALGEKITITPEEIKAYYTENIASYQTPEQRHARHILLRASDKDSPSVHQEKQKKAAELLQLLKDNSDFADLAEKYSDDPSKGTGGDLGFFPQGSMVPEFDTAVFAMQPGQISKVIKTQFGYHIIKLEEIKAASTKPLVDVQSDITRILQLKQGKQMAFQLANDAYEGIIKAGSLKTFTDSHPEISAVDTDLFPRSQPPAGIGQNQKFLDAAFALNKGELSSLIETDAGYAILFALDKKDPIVPPLESIKEKVTVDYVAYKSQEKAKTTATGMLDTLKKGAAFSQIVAKTQFKLEDSGFLSKKTPSQSSGFPASLYPQVFQLSKSSALPKEPAQVEDGYLVFAFHERKVSENKAGEQDMQKYRDILVRFKQQQLLTAWIGNLKEKAEITRHKSL